MGMWKVYDVMFSPQRENSAEPIQARDAPARCSSLLCWLWLTGGCWGRWHSEQCSDRGAQCLGTQVDEQTETYLKLKKNKKKHVAVSTFKSPKIRKQNMTKWIYFCTTGWPVLAGCSRWRRGDRGWRRPRQSLWFITSISDVIVFLPHAERSFWQHTFETLENLPVTDKLFKVTLVCQDSVSFLCSAHFRGTSSPSSLKSTQRTGAWLRPRPPKNVYCSF